ASFCGVDGIMLVAPYYNKPNQRGLYQHFSSIAEATELPVMMYNIPGRTAVKMEASTILDLSRIDNIVAIKEATGDLRLAAFIIENTDSHFSVYSGDDDITLPMLAIGADGVVSVASHIIGNEMNQMVAAYKNGKPEEAAALHRKWLPVMNGLFAQPSPAP